MCRMGDLMPTPHARNVGFNLTIGNADTDLPGAVTPLLGAVARLVGARTYGAAWLTNRRRGRTRDFLLVATTPIQGRSRKRVRGRTARSADAFTASVTQFAARPPFAVDTHRHALTRDGVAIDLSRRYVQILAHCRDCTLHSAGAKEGIVTTERNTVPRAHGRRALLASTWPSAAWCRKTDSSSSIVINTGQMTETGQGSNLSKIQLGKERCCSPQVIGSAITKFWRHRRRRHGRGLSRP